MEGRRQRGAKATRNYNSDPETERDDQSESSADMLTTRVDRRNPLGKEPTFTSHEPYESDATPIPSIEATVIKPLEMKNQLEIEVEDPNVNANLNDNDQRLIIYHRKGKVNRQKLHHFLYQAALRGDWEAAETVLNLDRSLAVDKITKTGDTALHVAAASMKTAFVHNLVTLYLNENELELPNKHGNTALCFAAISGIVEIAEVMCKKNKKLPIIPGSKGMTPLRMAAMLGKRKMVKYLYQIMPFHDLQAQERMEILVATIHADIYDIALKILKEDTSIVTCPTVKIGKALQVLAQKPLSHHEKCREQLWERLVRIIATVPYVPCFKDIYNSVEVRRQGRNLVERLWEEILRLPDSAISKLILETGIFHGAAKIGNVEFLTMLTHAYPDLIQNVNSNSYSIFHVAVLNRQEKVFNLIYHIGALKDLIVLYKDSADNNILHLAGKLAPPSRLNIVSGAALQMQRELLWFKEVEKIVPPSYLKMNNIRLNTPRELFSEEHKELREAGEKWMKDTASSCMVVATLIATVVFAAAFTVPGGNNNETGTPVFLNEWWFTIFLIFDGGAMLSSTASIMMFLSILTSRFEEDDFLFWLPLKLMVGLTSLFASIVCMVITFSATFFLAYNKEKQKMLPGIVTAVALIPSMLYGVLNYRLLIALFRSTFYSRSTFQGGKLRLY